VNAYHHSEDKIFATAIVRFPDHHERLCHNISANIHVQPGHSVIWPIEKDAPPACEIRGVAARNNNKGPSVKGAEVAGEPKAINPIGGNNEAPSTDADDENEEDDITEDAAPLPAITAGPLSPGPLDAALDPYAGQPTVRFLSILPLHGRI